jgi:hypothetical protein
MSRILTLLLITATLACFSGDNEPKGTPVSLAITRAALFCNVSENEMDWLLKLIVEIESKEDDLMLWGSIHAFRYNG